MLSVTRSMEEPRLIYRGSFNLHFILRGLCKYRKEARKGREKERMGGDGKEAGSSLLFISSHHSFLPPPVCSVHERPVGGGGARARARARERRLHNKLCCCPPACVLPSYTWTHEEAAALSGQSSEEVCSLAK